MIKLVARIYITKGVIISLTSFFYVPKVTDDIIILFDATVSGLNDYMWYPNFMLKSMGSLLVIVVP